MGFYLRTKEKKMNNQKNYIFTSESVNIGHPDKTCDYIADCFLDSALKQDANAQMAVECAIKDDLLMIYGEATTSAKIDYETIAKDALKFIGYENEFRIIKQISEQSIEINKAVVGDKEKTESELKANDQGIVFGYACTETPELMPMPIMLAHKLMKEYDAFRRAYKKGTMFFADAKSQVSINYENNKPVSLHTVLMSVSHNEKLENEEIYKLIKQNVIDKVLKSVDIKIIEENKKEEKTFDRKSFLNKIFNNESKAKKEIANAMVNANSKTITITSDETAATIVNENSKVSGQNNLINANSNNNTQTEPTKFIINPSGKFSIWGSFGDSGCVGRKIVVDGYGGAARVGGGCFSSKNATKVDRSGAYYARFAAKNVVANGYAEKCEIQVSYGIGMAKPISIFIETFGTNKKPIAEIENFINTNFDFSPSNIIKELDLLKPIYKQTAAYGHFGRNEFSWEKTKNIK
jgi:S-adenosylmethionine synthetase